jgi:beta-glucosidase
VLLKNVNGALPLKEPRSLVLIGSDAGAGISGPNDNQFGAARGVDGVLVMGSGSGTTNMTYLVTVRALAFSQLIFLSRLYQPRDAIQRRAREDHTSVFWFFNDFDLARAGNVARKKSAALVFISADSGEGADR